MRLFIPVLIIVATLSGCTESMKTHSQHSFTEIKEHSYISDIATILGFYDVFPSRQQRQINHEKNICLHTNSQNRVIIMHGVEDKIYERRCAASADAVYDPLRLQGRTPHFKTEYAHTDKQSDTPLIAPAYAH